MLRSLVGSEMCIRDRLKLALSLLAYGMPAVDAEHTIHELAKVMKLPKPDLEFKLRSLSARFVEGIHTVKCARGIDFDKLTSCAELTDWLHRNSEELCSTCAGVRAAISTLHDIQHQPKPYGWLIQLLNSESLCIFAAVGAYSGDWEDASAVALIAPLPILVSMLCRKWAQYWGTFELVLCPLLIGAMTAVVYRNLHSSGELCRVSIWYLSCLLIHLPGSDVVYGAYETLHASVENGAARVVGGVLKAMALAVMLNVGWQISGREAVTEIVDPHTHAIRHLSGAAASFVPFSSCSTAHNISWQVAYAACNLVLVSNICLAFNMRLRKMILPVLVGYLSLYVFGYLTFGLTGSETISGYVVNVITLLVAGTLAVTLELLHGSPSCISVIPVVLILAPGSSSVSYTHLTLPTKRIV
eukprot:TRINITY_DN30114_c0_g1_i1.p1 TRINITY_DN30114_c0_g1~~TRINITY_DN30114_c0_g1_i1.p1  ORF type:complete len:414 (+),score=85.73 TRINITY_DN30114_c0_g1_i1:109-1350(+)